MSSPQPEASAPNAATTSVPGAPGAAEYAAPWRVLVVDDDEVDRMAVRRALLRSSVPVAVDEAADAAEALAAVASVAYDCVFLDYNIPGSDGIALLRDVRQAGLDVPVVMLTGQGDEQVAVALMKAGAVDYLPKSAITSERLASGLRYAVELARAAAETRRAQEELRASAERARFLAEASAALASSLDVGATLDRVAQLAVPIIGDYCLIYLVEDQKGGASAVASAHHDPALAPLTKEIERLFRPDGTHPTSGIAEVIRTGRPRLMETIPPGHIESITRTAEEAELYRRLDPAAALFVPLVARQRVIGAVLFCRGAARPGFAPAELTLAEDLALRAATALDNASLFAEAQRARARTERLQEVTAQLAAVMPRDEVARLFVARVREALDADSAWLALLDDDGDALVSVADVGFEPGQIARFSRVPLDAPYPTREVLRDARPRWFASRAELWREYPSLEPPMRDMALEAVAMLPVTTELRMLGVMSVGFREPRPFEEADRALVLALAQQCAQALERARLYEAERHARAEAEAARREAEEANRAKSDFLARMSHDLRTPLNAIGGYAQLLELGVNGPVTEEQRASLARIRRAQEHLLTLINDILSFAKLEAGQVQLRIEDVVLDELLDDVRPLVEPQMVTKGLRFELPARTPSLRMRADRDRAAQVLVNLLTNAAKFTEPGGVVAVECDAEAELVAIRVRDTGRGIPPDRLESIFNPFVQVGRTAEEQRQGVGLGLAISRELARGMGGDLTVESEVGHGSEFTLSLPAAAGVTV